MNESRLRTIAQLQEFLDATPQVQFSAHGGDDDTQRNKHINMVLRRFDYPGCSIQRKLAHFQSECPMLDGDVPRYHQIYLHLRAEIADGSWVGQIDFPGEIALAERFGVSVITSRRALRRLADEHYIERGRGKRTRVMRGPTSAPIGVAPAIIQTSPGAPRTFTYQVLARGVQVAPAEACAAFGLPPGSKLWTCSRLRSHEDRPHSVTLNVQHVELGMNLPLQLLRTRPMSEILRSTGATFSRLSRRMSVALAPPHVAQHLGLTLNDPALIYTFTHHDLHDVVVQWVRIWIRGDERTAEETFNYKTGFGA